MLHLLLLVVNRGDVQRILWEKVLVSQSLDLIVYFLSLLHNSCHSSFLPEILVPDPNFLITAQAPLKPSSWHFFHGYFLLHSVFCLLLTLESILFYDTDKFLNSPIDLVKLLPVVCAAEGTAISHLSFVQILHAAQAKGVSAFKIDGMNHQLQTNGTCKFLWIKTSLEPSIAHFFVLLSVDHLLLLIFFTQKRSEVILGDTL